MAILQLIPYSSVSSLAQKSSLIPYPIPSPLSPNPRFVSFSLFHFSRAKPSSFLRCSASSFSEKHHAGSPESGDVVELPLFPLPLVLFPGAILPLQIFEFRYTMMMHTLLLTDLRFGVIYTDSVSGITDVGCVGEVVKHERLVDGRFFLICKGQERFRVTNIVRTKPYLVAEVLWLEDRPSANGEDDLEVMTNEVENHMKDVIRSPP